MRLLNFSNVCLLAGLAAVTTWSAEAQEFNLLPTGDSLTRGVGDDPDGNGNFEEKDEQRGYRDWLQRFLIDDPLGIIPSGATFDFIGNRENGLDGGAFPSLPTPGDPNGSSAGTPFDDDHAGLPGFSADQLREAFENGDPANTFFFPGGSYGNDTAGENLFGTTDGTYPGPTNVADFITLHIGTNDLLSGETGAQAGDSLMSLLFTLEDDFLNQGDFTPPRNADGSEGDPLGTTSRIADGAKILLANILPVFDTVASASIIGDHADYNAYIDSIFSGSPPSFNSRTLTDEFIDMLVQVDMEAILLDDVLIQHLFDYNPGVFVDEADLREQLTGSTTGDLVLWTDTGNATPYNDLLYQNDAIHLTDLGYQLMAYQWYRGFDSLVPEPTTLTMLMLAGGLVAGRRRRSA